jgi:hypothetical protein
MKNYTITMIVSSNEDDASFIESCFRDCVVAVTDACNLEMRSVVVRPRRATTPAY